MNFARLVFLQAVQYSKLFIYGSMYALEFTCLQGGKITIIMKTNQLSLLLHSQAL